MVNHMEKLNRRRKSSVLRVLKSSPFTYSQEYKLKHYLQLIFGTIFLCPIRLIFMIFFLTLAIFFAALGAKTRKKESLNSPITSPIRKILLRIAAFWGRLTFFAISFGPVTFIGELASREEASILVIAPHSSFFDVFIPLTLGLVSVVSKAKVSTGPLSSLALMSQPVLVDRDDKDSRRKALRDIADRCNLDKPWPQLAIFPEGTCSNRTALFKFKIGAFLPGKPVQPICVRWPNSEEFDTTTWTWNGPSLSRLLWMTMCQWNTKLVLEFLPVYKPSSEEILDPELYANNVRDKMSERLQIPTTEFSYQACKLITLAIKCELPMDLSIVDLSHFNKLLSQVYPETTLGAKNGPDSFQSYYDDCTLRSSGNLEQKAMRLARFTGFARDHPSVEWFQDIPEFSSVIDSNLRLFEGLAQCYLLTDSDYKVDTRRLASHMNILFHHGNIKTRFLKAMEVYKNISTDFIPTNPDEHSFNCDPIPGYAIERQDAKHFVEGILKKKTRLNTQLILDIVQTSIQRGNGHIFANDLYEVIKKKQPDLIASYCKYLKESHVSYQPSKQSPADEESGMQNKDGLSPCVAPRCHSFRGRLKND